MKKVLILSGSPRRNGNSDLLCDEFAKGANEGGNNVEKIFLRDKKVGYCTACYYCKSHNGECAIKDDMAEIIDKLHSSDVIVLASPVYFYSIDAQMKTVIDRCVAQWTTIKDKEFYYIMTAADNEKGAMDCTLECFRGLAACLPGSKEMGVIYGTGVYEPGKVKNTAAMKNAYKMGKEV
ncbi:MAG: flavodoxin family protein [Lachnospiraceae bacterium]|nr:flavodoxin family protein [Lachnospiraceae bacterium]